MLGKRMKKFLPFLATFAVCLVAAIALLIILPWFEPTKADDDAGKQPEENQQQIDQNPSIDDKTNDGNQNDTDTGDETTTPTDPEPTDPTDPVDPEPTEPEPEVIFVLTKENLRGTVWYDDENKLCLIFSETNDTYTLVHLTFTDGAVSSKEIKENDNWELSGNTITLKPKSDEYKSCLSYDNNVLTDLDWGYKFVWLLNNQWF